MQLESYYIDITQEARDCGLYEKALRQKGIAVVDAKDAGLVLTLQQMVNMTLETEAHVWRFKLFLLLRDEREPAPPPYESTGILDEPADREREDEAEEN